MPAICAAARRAHRHADGQHLGDAIAFPALATAADLTILACTKYIVGHSDVMLGLAVTATAPCFKRLRVMAQSLGQHVGTGRCVARAPGLRTCSVRLRL